MTQRERKIKIFKISATAILTALAVVLMYMEIPLPFMPPFLKFDFSELPVIIGSFALGPVYGLIIELLKNLIHLPATATAGIGELSNFLSGSIYVFSAGLIYSKGKNLKSSAVALSVAAVILAAVAIPLNYFVTLPLYGKVLGFSTEAIVGMSAAVNPLIKDKISLALWAFVPFNLFKAIVVGIFAYPVNIPVSMILKRNLNK